MASVRFICGTQDIHRQLEERLSAFLGTEDTILYRSCFDANGGLFETLLGERDAVISDELNHATIIDGIRLCKAQRLPLREQRHGRPRGASSQEAADARFRLIATDGVFSMDGYIANLDEICDLAERYDALVMVDDSHAVGFVGPTGTRHATRSSTSSSASTSSPARSARRSAARAAGTSRGRQEIVDLLRQRSRPYLFSNSVAPAVVGASLRALDLIERSDDLRDRLWANTRAFRSRMTELGFDVLPGDHPIVPVMVGDAAAAAAALAGARRARRLRGRVLLSGRAARHGADPDADVRRAHGRRPRARGAGVRRGTRRNGRVTTRHA